MGALGFAAPFMLAAFILLPALYYLLRLTPPKPLQVWFPPLKLLSKKTQEETPQSSPLWLILLRLALAACLILGFAQPLLHGDETVPLGGAPLVLLIDNGWTAASDWEARRAQAADLLQQARAKKIPVLLAATNGFNAENLAFNDAQAALTALSGLEPQPYLTQRLNVLAKIKERFSPQEPPQIVWLTDEIEGKDGAAFAAALAELKPAASVLQLASPPRSLVAIASITNSADALEAKLIRSDAQQGGTGTLRAFDRQNRQIGSGVFAFDAAAMQTRAKIEMPTQLRNDVFRLDLAGQPHAGAAFLLDEQFRRKTVGLYSGGVENSEQVALSSRFILEEALRGFAEVSKASGSLEDALQTFVRDGVGVIVLADTGALPASTSERLNEWIANGGVLLRFASSQSASAEPDGFLPVKLRPVLRTLGGQLSWEKPQGLGKAYGQMAGLDLAPDVTVTTQVPAEATADLSAKTWIDLADGTPLVTAEPRGRGQIVFVHVSADASWSNLPLSGTFLALLRKIVVLSNFNSPQAANHEAVGADPILKPYRTLNAFGVLTSPPAGTQAISAGQFTKTKPDAEHPPGLYGSEGGFQALNTVESADALRQLSATPNMRRVLFAKSHDLQLASWFFIGVLALFFLDILLSVLLLCRGRLIAAHAAAACLLLLAAASPSCAADEAALAASANITRLGYIRSGIADIDDVTQAGLKTLSRVLRERTSIRLEEPAALDLTKDELVFYPVIYWPIDPKMTPPAADGLTKAESYIKNGGTILFDTRDRGDGFLTGSNGASQSETILRGILAKINAPRLEPLPQDHVLTKAFYILNSFPGRFEDGPLYVEHTAPSAPGDMRPVRLADGVSSVIVTSNDMAGAWAADEDGTPRLPLYGSNERQREFAYRAGVNIVVYAMTGNYKADQVHVPDLLKRLGQ